MFLRTVTSRLGFAGIGACVLGFVISVGALAFYPQPTGSNPGGALEILFLALFFAGELIGLFGLGVLIYLGVYGRQNSKSAQD